MQAQRLMTDEIIDLDPPRYGGIPLTDYIQQLREVQDNCPDSVIPMITFRVVRLYDEEDIETVISYPRMETQHEADMRTKWDNRRKQMRHDEYVRLKAEFDPS